MIERIIAGFCAAAFSSLFCVGGAAAQNSPDLAKPAGAEWQTIGGDWHNTRYSTLKQITIDNVKQLKAAWAIHLGSGLGAKYSLEGTPIVQGGVMYMSSGNDDVLALDAKTGALIWEHLSGIDAEISTPSVAGGTIAAWRSAKEWCSSASWMAISSRSISRPASKSGERRSADGRMAIRSPAPPSITTARSIPARPAAIVRRAAR